MTAARPGQFTGATDNAADGGLFTDTLIDGIPDLVGADVLAAQTAATNAATSETNAANSETAAATSETNAATSATNAATSATNAATSAASAAADVASIGTSVSDAAASATAAATSATNAATSETAAAGSATSASSSATSATASANTAVTSASAAGTSATNAATSETNSANSAAASATSATASANSATASANSATAAQTAQTAAELAETNAETAETNAETAETNAASSASAAASSASAASTSETNAATSATNSANSATASANSATASATSATAAAASEAAAAGYVDNFDDKYLGAKTSDPTVDNDGDPLTDGALYYNTTDNRMKVYDLGTTTWLLLAPTNAEQININTVANDITNVNTVANNTSNINAVAADATDIGVVATNISNVNTVATNNANVNTVATNITDVNSFADTYFISATAPASPTTGDLWFDTANSIMKVYDGSGFVNAGSSVNGTSARYDYTATAGQTTFAAVYDTGYVDVYLNGVKLAPTDFTATNGSTIVLTTGAALNDTVGIVGYGTFSLASAVTLPDNVKATFGDSSDLQIYHDAGNSRIVDAGTGNLNLQADNNINILNNAGTEFKAQFITNGAVKLFHANSKKFETTSTGVDVTGTVVADGLTMDGDITQSGSGSQSISLERVGASKLDIGASTAGVGNFITTTTNDLFVKRTASSTKVLGVGNSTGDISFYDSTGVTQGFYWDADQQRLGLGTTSPSYPLHVQGNRLYLTNAGNTELMTTNTNGNVTGGIQALSNQSLRLGTITNYNCEMVVNNAVKGTWSANGLNVAGSVTANNYFLSPSAATIGTSSDTSIEMRTSADGTPAMLFRANGSSERMRIDSGGDLLVGKTSASLSVAGCSMKGSGDVIQSTRASGPALEINRLTTDGEVAKFYRQTVAKGSISVNASGTTYNTTSDIRLKTDIAPIADATETLMGMNAVTHKWKADPDADAVVGFIAQEMAEIVPEAVSKGEGEDDMWSMDYGRITPVLVAALQDALTKIEQLEQRIADMEDK